MHQVKDRIRIFEGRWDSIYDHLYSLTVNNPTDRVPAIRHERIELVSESGRRFNLTAEDGKVVIEDPELEPHNRSRGGRYSPDH